MSITKRIDPLNPLVCNVNGDYRPVEKDELEILENCRFAAKSYPLNLLNGEYFSEVMDQSNKNLRAYSNLINGSIKEIIGSLNNKVLDSSKLELLGKEICKLDEEFARKMMASDPDEIHLFSGPNPEHPYRKITLARTKFNLQIENTNHEFFYEKFMVVYSYFDKNKTRRPTITPIHSHPLNHEVVYFLESNENSEIIETEYGYFNENNQIDVSSKKGRNNFLKMRPNEVSLRPIETHIRNAEQNPLTLDPFKSEVDLSDPALLLNGDGFFRPHKVEVKEDPQGTTLYYAINNYWSPTGKVYVFDENGKMENTWKHDEWES